MQEEKLYPDPHGINVWNQDDYKVIYVHIVNSNMYERITGKTAPSSPISAKTYTEYGYPWFELYDEDKGDVEASDKLKGVKSIKEKDIENTGTVQQDDNSIKIPKNQKKKIK